MKVARWERYQTDPMKSFNKQGHKCTNKCRSRHNGWDTSKLVAQIKRLEKISTIPAKRP